MLYIVVCLNDVGDYMLATRTAWERRDDAVRYAATVAASRKALVVECPFGIIFRTEAL